MELRELIERAEKAAGSQKALGLMLDIELALKCATKRINSHLPCPVF